METTPSSGLFELSIDSAANGHLKEAARWAKFLAIVGFIFCAFFLLFAVVAGSLLPGLFNTMGTQGLSGSSFSVVIIVIYSGLAAINFFPCLYLFKFASKMQIALRDNDQEQMVRSFRNIRAFFRFVGMLMIIALCFWAIGLLGIVLQAKLLHA
ncbi:MAG TPA: hypothetical protein VI233_12440, partial [Puia sp.]